MINNQIMFIFPFILQTMCTDTDMYKMSATDPELQFSINLQDCFSDRDLKMPGVILHDKLISDASFGTLPIKTEHSYSLNSDGDSIPESPRSLQNKMDGK